MKKLFAFLCSLTLLCTSVPVLPVTETAVITANADEEGTYENLKYMKYADYVTISGVTDKETIKEVNIPAEIDGLPVTRIVEGAFYYCKNLTSVTIPESVTIIWGGAFSHCSSLTSVTIPESVTSIGPHAFFGCSSLTSVIIPDSVTSIGEFAFSDCSSLTSVTIPESMPSIGDGAFANTPWLEAKQAENPLVVINHILIDGTTCEGDVTIPEGVTSIWDYAFSGCSSLTSVTIPDSVTSIGYGAFKSCSSLTSVTIPKGVTSIGEFAFSDCSSLTSVTIPESVTSIGGYAFDNTPWLKAKQEENPLVIGNGILIDGTTCEGDVTIPESVTSIGYGAFKGCSSLTSVIIPESVTSIGDEAFYYCENLTSVIIPESVTSIGEGAFDSCSSLTSVTIENPDCEIYDSRYTISNGYENDDGYFNGTIYGYEGSTAQAYAEKYHFQFQSLGSAPELTTETAWNEINPDLNRDAKIDAKDAALVLVFAAEYGAGNIKNFAEFMDKQYPNQVQSLDTATETAWNEINPDMNRDGKIDAKDAALVLVFAAEFGAGNVKSFQEFMDKQYPEG